MTKEEIKTMGRLEEIIGAAVARLFELGLPEGVTWSEEWRRPICRCGGRMGRILDEVEPTLNFYSCRGCGTMLYFGEREGRSYALWLAGPGASLWDQKG